MNRKLRHDAEKAAYTAINAVMPEGAVRRALLGKRFPGRVFLIAAGKAAPRMALEASCRTYIALKTGDMARTKRLLQSRYAHVEADEGGYLRIYDIVPSQEVVRFLYENEIVTGEIKSAKINLEEYYIDLMREKEGR